MGWCGVVVGDYECMDWAVRVDRVYPRYMWVCSVVVYVGVCGWVPLSICCSNTYHILAPPSLSSWQVFDREFNPRAFLYEEIVRFFRTYERARACAEPAGSRPRTLSAPGGAGQVAGGREVIEIER